jgi:ATP:corrinoid adenosyltransferase
MGISVSQMMTAGFRSNIASHREEFPEANHLSGWQIATAIKVSSAVQCLATGLQEGPIYIPTPTGSGKTTGAIWGIIRLLDHYYDDIARQRICFLTPYQDAVDEVYDQLVQHLGHETVGHYHSEAKVDKDEALKKQVIVVTHQFLEFNAERLNDRDIFIVDEALLATGVVSLKLQDILDARSWATSHNILKEEFEQLAQFAKNMDTARLELGAPYIAAPEGADLSWAKAIAFDLNLKDHRQTIGDLARMTSVQKFCAATVKGQVFLAESNKDKERYDPIFYGADLDLPNLGKTLVLSATAGLIYELAGPFRHEYGTKHYWAGPSYEQLKLVQLSGPKIDGHYCTWSQPSKKDEVVGYVDWLLREIPEQRVYMSLPKQVLDGCLRQYLGQQQNKEIAYPIIVERHGKTVHVSHHSLSIGSNQFRDCDAVIYLWDNHLPQAVAVNQYHALAGERITQQTLDQISGGRLTGHYRAFKEAAYLSNMIQHIGRGRVRNFDDNGIADPMSVYVLTQHADRFEKLVIYYQNCQRGELRYNDNQIPGNKGRISRVVAFIAANGGGRDIPGDVVETALGFRLSAYAVMLSCNNQLAQLDYEFVPGTRGRRKGSMFKYVGELIENPSAALPEQ